MEFKGKDTFIYFNQGVPFSIYKQNTVVNGRPKGTVRYLESYLEVSINVNLKIMIHISVKSPCTTALKLFTRRW